MRTKTNLKQEQNFVFSYQNSLLINITILEKTNFLGLLWKEGQLGQGETQVKPN